MAAQKFKNGALFMADDPFWRQITKARRASGRMAGWKQFGTKKQAARECSTDCLWQWPMTKISN